MGLGQLLETYWVFCFDRGNISCNMKRIVNNAYHFPCSMEMVFLVAFVKDNATMGLIRYFESHVSYFVQNRRK